ncbi:Uncharacterized protein FWK35_00030194 [Aphis craccivora]|uniref:DUF8207 domain-containing protein n=1 Tax=Aphis craccivora TaxID=307492 RepID=A0A6G0VTE2_APHCR|nr:Uncharacterized protein FWK35_00030194 [Aphis craccivora]
MLCEILKNVDEVQLFTFYENDEVIPPEKALPDSVFIFDDILCENQNIYVLNELVIAKENIKRKFEALKRGDADIQFYVSQTFKPIIEPLNKLHNQSPTPQTSEAGNDNDISNAIEDFTTDYRTGTFRSLEENEKDKIYGPRKNSDGVIKLGHEEVKFKNNEIIIKDSSFQLTPGLLELLFSRYPMQYTDTSQSSGNTGVSNKILSIFEELYEAERFNRTLKTNMYREFNAQGSHKWLSILPILKDNYNNSKHRTIGMTPVQAEENLTLVTLKQRTIVN